MLKGKVELTYRKNFKKEAVIFDAAENRLD
jgi:hypothetical protein